MITVTIIVTIYIYVYNRITAISFSADGADPGWLSLFVFQLYESSVLLLGAEDGGQSCRFNTKPQRTAHSHQSNLGRVLRHLCFV